MNIDTLNRKFGIPNTLSCTRGQGDFLTIEIANTSATAVISTHGGQILSYRPNTAAHDLFFVSERAEFAPAKAIKGGIPICWPWFGADFSGAGRPTHGFVRTLDWEILETQSLGDATTRVRLGIADDAATHTLWPESFHLRIEITVGATLEVALVTQNTGGRPFNITQGLHAYFLVGDVTTAQVEGLAGCHYLDKAADGSDRTVQQLGSVRFAREVNRIYLEAPAQLDLLDPCLGRRIRIDSSHSRTAVVWNPWVEMTRTMSDLADDDYQRFVCVETVNAAAEVIEIPAGEERHIAARYSLEPL